MVDQSFLSDRVRSLLSRFAREKGPLRPPVDALALANLCGVLSVEHRRMVPEGVLAPVQGGFKMYVQSNFEHHRGFKVRERFTIAHEIVHTFFYEPNGDVPRRIKGAPRGEALERLCHIGAGQLLVPEGLLRRELDARGEVASVEAILDLIRVFNVSAEVLIRRLHETKLFAKDEFAAILVDAAEKGKRTIRAACHGSLVLCLAPQPKRGLDFDSWVLHLRDPLVSQDSSKWTYIHSTATVFARKVYRSKRSFVLELRLAPPRR